MTDFLGKSFDGLPVRRIAGEVDYLVNTLTDHVPATSPDIIQQIVEELRSAIDVNDCDLVVGEEERGGYIASIFGYATTKKFTLAKWNPVGLIGEGKITFTNAYVSGMLYLNGVRVNDRVFIIEDFVDTGGTMIALINLVREMGATVVEAIAVAEKLDRGARGRIKQETGVDIKSLVQIAFADGRSKVVNRPFYRTSECA